MTIWASLEKHATKVDREAEALATIERRFGGQFQWVTETIEAYERMDEPESCFVYDLDKIIPYLVMAGVDHQPSRSRLQNEASFFAGSPEN